MLKELLGEACRTPSLGVKMHSSHLPGHRVNTAGIKTTSMQHLSAVCPSSRTFFMPNDAPALVLCGAVSPTGCPRAPLPHTQGAQQLSPATTLPDKSIPCS